MISSKRQLMHWLSAIAITYLYDLDLQINMLDHHDHILCDIYALNTIFEPC